MDYLAGRIGALLDFVGDYVGHALLAMYAGVVLVSLALAFVFAVTTGQWVLLLLVLALPALWLVMWRTG